jgi:non-homologous end joining protein Ku
MASRAIWKGQFRLSLVSIPVGRDNTTKGDDSDDVEYILPGTDEEDRPEGENVVDLMDAPKKSPKQSKGR